MQSADQFAPFLELSPELRLLIYHHVWPGPDDGQSSNAPNSNIRRSNIAAESALLRVCRTTCIEASPIFFTKNAFVATIASDSWHWLPKWLQLIGPKHTSLIPSLTIEWHLSQRTLDWFATHHNRICHWAEDEPSCQKSTASLPILTSPDVGFALALATAYPAIPTDLHEYTQLELTNTWAAINLAIAFKNVPGLHLNRIHIPEDSPPGIPPFTSVAGSGCMEETKIIRDICGLSQMVFHHKLEDDDGDGEKRSGEEDVDHEQDG
ncbi:hypothetical protein CB0940_09905 [Cercospora beticola]|uniref:Uncharacterized protein n=1 Tax=Cercospora beticola TaxID=122368 RepID=A0A2G5HFU9_CERBT|nr:hypothetical protein CB0940_09905 [Cercospora beticola]PIA91375.1 hypothetical protein CB0940_09905 [Cercospora beticola]WPB05748.1 hypothetical protein RHO25_010402 [Cercospora beticola]